MAKNKNPTKTQTDLMESRRKPQDEAGRIEPKPRKPRAPGGINGDELRARLRAYDRGPFLEVLALFLECMPSEEAILAFADKYPDKYAAALGTIGSLAGFTSKTESTHNINVNVAQMSDSQLEDELKKLGYDRTDTIDVEFTDVKENSSDTHDH